MPNVLLVHDMVLPKGTLDTLDYARYDCVRVPIAQANDCTSPYFFAQHAFLSHRTNDK